MGFQHYASFVFLVTIFVLNLSTSVRATATDLCQKAEFPEVCQSIVKDGPGIDLETAVQMSIQAAIVQTNQAKAMLHKLKPPQDDLGKSNLKTCYDSYDAAIANLNESAENLKSKSMADLKINLSAVITSFTTCDNTFEEDAAMVDPVAKINEFLGKIARNSLTLASTMEGRDL